MPPICCKCPWRVVLHPRKHPDSENSQYVNTETPGMQKKEKKKEAAFIWMSEGQNIWNADKIHRQRFDKQLKQSVFLRLDGWFYISPPLTISVECVYSHIGLKERWKREEKAFLKDTTAFVAKSNYILKILKLFSLKSSDLFVLHNGGFWGEKRQRHFFPPSMMTALYLVNDWIVPTEAS